MAATQSTTLATERDPLEREAEAFAEHVQQLADRVGQSRCYLLLQLSERDTALDALFQQALNTAKLEPEPVKLAPLPKAVWPRLVPIDLSRGADAYLSSLAARMACEDMQPKPLRSGQVQRACGWIFSELAPVQLARRIAKQALRRDPQRRKQRWVRFYDPMVLDQVWDGWASEQRGSAMEGIRTWAYRNRWRQLTALTPPEAEAPRLPPPLSAVMWRRLEAAGALNQAWIRACLQGLAVEPAQWREAGQALAHAQAQGLHARDDLDLFAWQALRLGRGFHRHPLVEGLLGRVGPQASYCDLAQTLDEAQWQEVAATASASQQPDYDKESHRG